MEFYEYLDIIKRRTWFIVAITLAAAVSSWAVSHYIVEKVYESKTMIMVSRADTAPVTYDNAQQYELLKPNYIKVYYTLGESDLVAQNIIQSLQLNSTVKQFKERMSIEADYETGIIKISVHSINAQLAVDIAREFIKSLKEQSEMLTLKAEINIIDEPKSPQQPVSPNIILNVLLSAAAGFLAGILLAIFFGVKDASISEIPALNSLPWLRLLGRLPKLKIRKSKKMPVLFYPSHSQACESIQLIGINLQRLIEHDAIKSILVSSPHQSEGKTTFAVNAAISMAQLQKRILVIDCNFRKPGLHHIYDLEKCDHTIYTPDQYPKNNCVVYHDPSFGIDLVSDFSSLFDCMNNPGFGFLRTLLNDVGSKYDLIILDCPPVLPYADTLMLYMLVEGVVLVADYKRLTVSVLKRCIRRLKQLDANILGIVVNGLPARKMRY